MPSSTSLVKTKSKFTLSKKFTPVKWVEAIIIHCRDGTVSDVHYCTDVNNYSDVEKQEENYADHFMKNPCFQIGSPSCRRGELSRVSNVL